MSDCATEALSAVPQAGSARSWSVGVFGHSEFPLPSACLAHCLNDDPAMASTRGCAMVRRLVERALAAEENGAAGGESVEPPAICDKGFAVSLFEADDPGGPDVLILRPPMTSAVAEKDLAPAIEAMRSATSETWRLNRENDGLAEEVLRSYEQINLIFDVSAQIAILTDAEEVRRTLLTKLRHMFGADSVFCVFGDRRTVLGVSRDGEVVRGWTPGNGGLSVNQAKPTRIGSWDLPALSVLDLPPEFDQACERLEQSRGVFVSTADSGEQAGHGTAMWGALADDEKTFSIVGVIRRHAPFSSGDMLLLDSTLTYGGHILRNLRLVEQLQQTSFEVVRMLVNAIDQKDNYTSGHSERVGFLARVTGRHMGLPTRQLKELEWAALLHDVGKIGIPEQVLNKPGKLTPEEYAIIQGHPSRGDEILEPVASLEPVLEGVLYHHENPDGSGYPEGLEGDDIPLLASIIHVVDVFDALTSTRSYRKAFPTEKALQILKEDAGTKLDAKIVEHFFGVWARLPITHPEEHARWFGEIEEERR